MDSGQKIRSVENGPMDAWTVTFSPCAQKIVSGSHVGKINMFSTETGQSEQGRQSHSLDRAWNFVVQKMMGIHILLDFALA